ncbi:MAG: nicotinate (nicotinamide) nucleotide adenylyltransferase [Phycisphaerae bacterium]
MAESIIIFGGTFDPVHNGHLIVARAAAEARGIGRVMLVPAAVPPHKPPAGAAGEHRLEMLKLAVADEPVFEVSDTELRRGGPSYTIDTLEEFAREMPGTRLHLLIGADMLEDLPAWHRAHEVVATAEVVVAARRPWQERLEEVFSGLADEFGARTVERLRESLVKTPRVDISSTDIRRRVGKGLSVRYLVPDSVEQYIHEHRLYAQAAD